MAKTPKSSVSKLVPRVTDVAKAATSVPGVSRRQQYSAATKRALVDVAQELFTAQGYAATSLDSIVAGARVTKGALYHHFSGKQALFEAVFERVEAETSKAAQRALKGHRDPWDKARAGLEAFIVVVQDPGYRRIVIQEGPAVLGYERFREQEERSTFAIVLDIVRAVLSAGTWELEEDMLQTFARIFYGALSAAGDAVASADDPDAAAERVERALAFIIAGFQALVETGAGLPDAAPRD
ncbi:TetR/AcrR family transcriptional regulator [Nocardioides sp. TRM66260-LWL]|uniref:TetR/AcrR family transcriptional regulator n=1 Tax=Nocardioides sp. TRM66260-LWL TaxID=2874478 RepID=UPI001CC648CD|nr:TetR/AcrR family transcriptional regulator [Nocardioides sp. TRM66260-LWL]MBZ5732927.1 TetR/AcrR family transcriptional regulator [Nocardioides sp. TRM66260-LWL]